VLPVPRTGKPLNNGAVSVPIVEIISPEAQALAVEYSTLQGTSTGAVVGFSALLLFILWAVA
jgi:hypothetical protein